MSAEILQFPDHKAKRAEIVADIQRVIAGGVRDPDQIVEALVREYDPNLPVDSIIRLAACSYLERLVRGVLAGQPGEALDEGAA